MGFTEIDVMHRFAGQFRKVTADWRALRPSIDSNQKASLQIRHGVCEGTPSSCPRVVEYKHDGLFVKVLE